jgi:hypothetical protein
VKKKKKYFSLDLLVSITGYVYILDEEKEQKEEEEQKEE